VSKLISIYIHGFTSWKKAMFTFRISFCIYSENKTKGIQTIYVWYAKSLKVEASVYNITSAFRKV
jgi:hypothetical protein